MVNAQYENSFHFSVRNSFRIVETTSNGWFEPDFARVGTGLQFCVAADAHFFSFAMQNIRA
jgi:hypothetical protein